jgi:hypothetical protein
MLCIRSAWTTSWSMSAARARRESAVPASSPRAAASLIGRHLDQGDEQQWRAGKWQVDPLRETTF